MAPLRKILLAQTLDHALVTGVWAILVIATIGADAQEWLELSTASWIGALGFLGVLGWFYRIICWFYLDRTLGTHLAHLQLHERTNFNQLAVGCLVEGFHVVLPVLWVLELAARIRHQRIPLRYEWTVT